MKLLPLVRKLILKHTDFSTKAPELIILGWCDNEVASEHISRYIFASKFAHGVVLDVASGTCYGSSILNRNNAVKATISVDISEGVLQYGQMVYSLIVYALMLSIYPSESNASTL